MRVLLVHTRSRCRCQASGRRPAARIANPLEASPPPTDSGPRGRATEPPLKTPAPGTCSQVRYPPQPPAGSALMAPPWPRGATHGVFTHLVLICTPSNDLPRMFHVMLSRLAEHGDKAALFPPRWLQGLQDPVPSTRTAGCPGLTKRGAVRKPPHQRRAAARCRLRGVACPGARVLSKKEQGFPSTRLSNGACRGGGSGLRLCDPPEGPALSLEPHSCKWVCGGQSGQNCMLGGFR